MTLRLKPRWSRRAWSCWREASHGEYLRSGANGNVSAGPNTWQCASTEPGGSWKRGFEGLGCQSSQPGVFSRMLLPFLFQGGVEPREDRPSIGFVDGGLGGGGEDGGCLDVAFRVVVMKTGVGIDAAHRADHLAGEQDV